MTIAANQPYLFPYLGYFQLIAAADKVVMADSYQYVRHSWINRNRCLGVGKEYLMVASIKKASIGTPIHQMEYCDNFFDEWLHYLYPNYARAPFFSDVICLLQSLSAGRIYNVADFNIRGIEMVCSYLGIEKEIIRLSRLMEIPQGDKSDKTIEIVKACGGDRYINLPGGRVLYSKEYFARHGIELKFLEPYLPPYKQIRTKEFHPGLSIIDVIMNCSPEETREMIYNASFS